MAQAEVEWTAPPSGRKWSEGEGRAVVEALVRSGQSQAGFARQHGIQAQRIKYWVDRVRSGSAPENRAKKATSGAAAFAPVRVIDRATEGARRGSVLEVIVGVTVVRVPSEFDADHLRRVLSALGGGAC